MSPERRKRLEAGIIYLVCQSLLYEGGDSEYSRRAALKWLSQLKQVVRETYHSETIDAFAKHQLHKDTTIRISIPGTDSISCKVRFPQSLGGRNTISGEDYSWYLVAIGITPSNWGF